jgi:DNA-binding MarR family transcriptional regulator
VDVPAPSLVATVLRARRALVRVVRTELEDAGFSDLPRTDALYLSHLEDGPRSVGTLAGATDLPKQMVSQVLDTLVTRGYARREPDALDRRRVTVSLTPRGLAAAGVAREAAAARVRALVAREGAARVRVALEVLTTLVESAAAEVAT